MRSLNIRCDLCDAAEIVNGAGRHGHHLSPPGWLRLTGQRLAAPRRRPSFFPVTAPTRALKALARGISPELEQAVEEASQRDLEETRAAFEGSADDLLLEPVGVELEAGEIELCPACIVRPEVLPLLVERLRRNGHGIPPFMAGVG